MVREKTENFSEGDLKGGPPGGFNDETQKISNHWAQKILYSSDSMAGWNFRRTEF